MVFPYGGWGIFVRGSGIGWEQGMRRGLELGGGLGGEPIVGKRGG
jgi:hypothetical protein